MQSEVLKEGKLVVTPNHCYMGSNKIDLAKDTTYDLSQYATVEALNSFVPRSIGCVRRYASGNIVYSDAISTAPRDILFKGTTSGTQQIDLLITEDYPIWFVKIRSSSTSGGSGYGGNGNYSVNCNGVEYLSIDNTFQIDSSDGVSFEIPGIVNPTISLVYHYTETDGDISSYWYKYGEQIHVSHNLF